MAELGITVEGVEARAELGRAILRLKTGMSQRFAQAAALASRLAHKCEIGSTEPRTPELEAEHASHVIGAVINSVCLLESCINELYLEAVDRNPYRFDSEHQTLARLMGHVWEVVEEASLLKKYQIALELAQKSPFPSGELLYQDVDGLIKLRNALVHYKPEWDDELEEHAKIEQRVARRFSSNPFSSGSQAFIPHRCLGHGCAEWSVRGALTFRSAFFVRIGLPAPEINDPANLALAWSAP